MRSECMHKSGSCRYFWILATRPAVMLLSATCSGNVSLKRGFIDMIMQHAFDSVFQRHVGRLKVVLHSYTAQKHTVQQAGSLHDHRAETFHQPTGAENLPSCDRFLRCPRSLTNPASASSSRPASATDSPAEAGTVLAEAVSTAFSAGVTVADGFVSVFFR